MGSRTNNSKDQFPKWVSIISENWHNTWIWTFEKRRFLSFLNPHFSGFMLVYEFSGVPITPISSSQKKTTNWTSDPMTHPSDESYIYLLIYLITSTIHVGTPGKINVEPENGGLEDDFSCSIWWILVPIVGFHANFQGNHTRPGEPSFRTVGTCMDTCHQVVKCSIWLKHQWMDPYHFITLQYKMLLAMKIVSYWLQ